MRRTPTPSNQAKERTPWPTPKKPGDDELYTFPQDFAVNGDCGPHAEQLTGTISPWTPEGVPEAEMQAQDRVWVITNMKADRRTIVEGKVFVCDSGAIVGMDFAGQIDKIAFDQIQGLCVIASAVSGYAHKEASRSKAAEGGAGRRAMREPQRLELPPPFTKTERTIPECGDKEIVYEGDPDHKSARGRSAESYSRPATASFACIWVPSTANARNVFFHGANAIPRSEAAIRAWMEADDPWPGREK